MAKAAAAEACRLRLSRKGASIKPERVSKREPNAIRTTRFTPLSWLPKSLYLQFHRAANVYFISIAAISTIPFVEAKWQPKVFLVIFILLAQACKDLYEDLKRRWDDQAENTRLVGRFNARQSCFEETEWCEIDMGDLLIVERGSPFPADTLVVASAETTGNFYVGTKSMDGETNLKERRAPTLVHELIEDSARMGDDRRQASIANQVLDLALEIRLEAPTANVMEMNCTVATKSSPEPSGVSKDNFGLRGCELQSTAWVIGVACYVGDETKVRLNSFPPPSKSSELERFLNNCVLCILAVLVAISVYFSLASEIFLAANTPFYKIFLMYLVILYPVLPMTLYITFEILHLIIGFQIEMDPLMYDEHTEANAKARNTSVVEEIGQVDFVFSDKTGTLTANEMRFAFCCVGNATLGPFLPAADGRDGPGLDQARAALEGKAGQQRCNEVRMFFEALAVCHTVKIDEDATYQGESPDEVALVQAASDAGIVLESREAVGSSVLHRVRMGSRSQDHEITTVLGFTSDRARMSVVETCSDGSAIVTTKGADSIMAGLLKDPLPPQATRALAEFSRQGLRTLVVARKTVPPADFSAWRARWSEASSAMEDRSAKLELAAKAIEGGLTYVGITALEDRLQDHVPATIATLREGGIRVWVLTGDKVETAVEIAKSCKLLDAGMQIVKVVGASSSQECTAVLKEARGSSRQFSLKGMPLGRAMVLDGMSVGHILADDNARKALYEVAVMSSSCVCCRLSPMQKRELVEMVRMQNPKAITLAIGDGANDVPMIQGAHVGVGIRGKEGSAAVQASDMAISQFHFLGNLVFCHGRKAYRRIATFLCFFIYKSVALGWSYVVYAHSMHFNGKGAYPQWLDVIWNPLTSCAVVMILAFDIDYPDKVALDSPELYSPGPDRALFNPRTFSYWMLLATVQGVMAWSIPVYGLTTRSERWGDLPNGGPFWQASFTAFTINYFIVHLKLLLVSERPLQGIGLLSFILELVIYAPVAIYLGSPMAPSHELLHAPTRVFTSWQHVLCILLVPLAALTPEAVEAALSWRDSRKRNNRSLMGSTDVSSLESGSSSDESDFHMSDSD